MRYLGGAADAEARRHQIRADGAKARKSVRYVPRKCEIENWDKAERIQVADFDRADMPRWNDVASYGTDNAANGSRMVPHAVG